MNFRSLLQILSNPNHSQISIKTSVLLIYIFTADVQDLCGIMFQFSRWRNRITPNSKDCQFHIPHS
jgi:hypothetical protein